MGTIDFRNTAAQASAGVHRARLLAVLAARTLAVRRAPSATSDRFLSPLLRSTTLARFKLQACIAASELARVRAA